MKQELKLFNGKHTPSVSAPERHPAASTLSVMMRYRVTDDGTQGLWLPVAPVRTLQQVGGRAIGGIYDKTYNRYFIFLKGSSLSSDGEAILCVEMDGTVRTVLLGQDVEGSLSFDKTHHVSAITVDTHLIFTDDSNRPRHLFVERLMFSYDNTYQPLDDSVYIPYSFPLKEEDITLCKRPPMYRPKTSKADVFVHNFIEYRTLHFAFRYIYEKGAESVLGPYSATVPPNAEGETYNAVVVEMPAEEVIPQTVEEVEVLVREDYGDWQVWHRFDRTAIDAHNSGTPLTATYGNTRSGTPVGSTVTAKLWDEVPARARAITMANGRLVLGNTEEGLSPALDGSGLSVTVNSENNTGGSVQGTWIGVSVTCPEDYETGVFVEITGYGTLDGWYFTDVPYSAFLNNTLPSEITLSSSALVPVAARDELDDWLSPCGGSFTSSSIDVGPAVTVYGLGGSPPAPGSAIAKSNSRRKAGIAFFDAWGRTDGVRDITEVVTGDIGYNWNTIYLGYDWTLPSGIQLTRIPIWAQTYAICMTRDLDRQSFLQFTTDVIRYAQLNDDGTYTTTATLYSPDMDNLAFDKSALTQAGIGYDPADGDVLIANLSTGTDLRLKVVEVYADWIITEVKDLGDLTGVSARCEVYTPVTGIEEPVFYVATQHYAIDRSSGLPQYSVTGGTIQGDVFVIEVGGDNVEAMTPNSKALFIWGSYGGKPLIEAKQGAKRHFTRHRWSDTWFTGGPVSFNSFYPLNFSDAPTEMGYVQGLYTVDRTTTGGTVLVSIGTNRVTTAYVDATELVDMRGESSLVRSDNYLTRFNVLASEYGTTAPESIAQVDNYIFFVDLRRGVLARYSIGGVTDVGLINGFAGMIRSWSERLMRAAEVPYVCGAIDRVTSEYLLSMPEPLLLYVKGQSQQAPDDMPEYEPSLAWSSQDIGTGSNQQVVAPELYPGQWYRIYSVVTGLGVTSVMISYNGEVIIDDPTASGVGAWVFVDRPNPVFIVSVDGASGSIQLRADTALPNYHMPDNGYSKTIAFSNVTESFTTSWPVSFEYMLGGGVRTLVVHGGHIYLTDEPVESIELFDTIVTGWVSFLLPWQPVPRKLYGLILDSSQPVSVHVYSDEHRTQATSMDYLLMNYHEGRWMVGIYKDMLTPGMSSLDEGRYRGDTIFGKAPSLAVRLNGRSAWLQSALVSSKDAMGHRNTM